MDPDRILMKAMKDITIVKEDRRRSANLKGEVSGSMKRHLASSAEAIALAREKRRVEFEDSADSTITALKFELQRTEERQKALEKRNRLLEREVEKLRKEGKNDTSMKKSGSCYKNALPQRGQEKAASRCKITEDIRIPKESVVAKRQEKLSKPLSNNEARIDSLVASVATLATAIAEIQRQLKGAECKGRATKFAEALNKALPEAKVALPKRTRELVVCGLDAGISKSEIVSSITGLVAGLESRDVRVSDIYPGKGRLGQAYVSAPLNAVKQVVKVGSLSIGWFKARVRALNKRPLRCYRCQARVHVGA
ncbi:hypothetical protein M0802_012035 [Mischocyttarus mexicanus]|nr:hypothetical protein M0802_012035 [Mischocyttarus mexicanus]